MWYTMSVWCCVYPNLAEKLLLEMKLDKQKKEEMDEKWTFRNPNPAGATPKITGQQRNRPESAGTCDLCKIPQSNRCYSDTLCFFFHISRICVAEICKWQISDDYVSTMAYFHLILCLFWSFSCLFLLFLLLCYQTLRLCCMLYNDFIFRVFLCFFMWMLATLILSC